MKAIHYLLGLVLLLPLFASAQNAPEPAQIRFLFLDESAGNYAVKIGPNYTDLGSKPYVISPVFEFFAGTRLELYKQLPDPETGELVRTRVVNLTVSASPSHALVVVAPSTELAEGGTPTYRSRLYDVSPQKTPPRSVRVINLSPSPMAARFGTEKVEISPGAEQLVVPVVDKRSRIRVFVASQGVGEWSMIFNSFISLPENNRTTGVVVYSPSGMRHTYTQEEIDTLGPPKAGFFWLTFTDTVGSG